MKRIVVLGVLFFVSRLQAQELLVCYDKTVNVIFPYAIVSEDHGSNAIIAQQRKGAADILQVKANQKNFAPTSLSVLTSDGRFYAFVVRYAGDVTLLNYIVDPQESVVVTAIPHNQQILEWDAARVASAAGNMCSRSHGNLAVLRLRGLYVSAHALWLKAQVIDRTLVRFRPGFVKFFIRSKRRAKNAAGQEREVLPVFRQGGCLFAFDPFVMDRHQRFVMQVGELNGDRLLQLRIRPRHFRKMTKVGSDGF